MRCLAYDSAGRLQTKTILGTPSEVTTFSYGEVRAGFYNLGRLTTVTSPADTLKTDYDAAGRPVKQTRTLGGIDYTVERRYAAAGRVLGVTYPGGSDDVRRRRAPHRDPRCWRDQPGRPGAAGHEPVRQRELDRPCRCIRSGTTTRSPAGRGMSSREDGSINEMTPRLP